jgi:hypothetical protein
MRICRDDLSALRLHAPEDCRRSEGRIGRQVDHHGSGRVAGANLLHEKRIDGRDGNSLRRRRSATSRKESIIFPHGFARIEKGGEEGG